MACTDPKYSCSTDANCPVGTRCDTSQNLCVIPGGCTQICKSNEACVAAVCVAQTCPVCNANEVCDDTTFKCVAVTTGTISLVSPSAGGVIGGPAANVVARAGAPNGGPLHVDFMLASAAGATLSTVSVGTGDAQGNYTGTLNLTGASTSTGATLVATVFWKDAAGATQTTSTGATTVNIDETAPSITGISGDRAFYSTVANPSGSATVTATIADSGGSSGVNASTVQLTVGNNAPIAGTLQTGSQSVFQFAVPLAQLSAGANTITLSAADVVNNTGSQTGTLNVDNIAPALSSPSVPPGTTWFSGTDAVTPLSVNASDTGGSGVDQSTAKIEVDASHGPYAADTTGATDSWTSLTGASFAADNTQGAVAFNFTVKDGAGNPAAPSSQSVNVDRKPPLVNTVAAPGTWSARSGNVTVTAVVDDTGGSGPASAALHVNGQTDVAGTTGGSGSSRTYSFSVPASYQAAGSETPVAFSIAGTDAVGNTTAAANAGSGTLLIDDLGPSVNSITVNGGLGIGGVKWFQEAGSGNVDVQADIQDLGSGVKASTLTLINTADSLRLDNGTPTCGAPALGVVTCHFNVALNKPGAGNQALYNFKVAGTDNVGNPMQPVGVNPANAGKVGIDGAPPSVSFGIVAAGVPLTAGNTSNYPSAGKDCNGNVADNAMFCGHDGSHYFRKGELNAIAFTASDGSSGSGVDGTASKYSIAGSTNCPTGTPCAATDAGGGSFTFVPSFASATFSSGSDGTGTVSVTVTAKDAVGNTASATVATVAVTRVKWVRSMAGKLDTLKASPVVTSVPTSQIIFAGIEKDTSGPIASFAPDGSVLWRAGHLDATNISNNVAYSSATKRLYVLGDSATKLFAYDVNNVASAVAPQLYACTIDDGSNSCGSSPCGQASGAPAILAGTTERVLVADSGEHRLWAFSGSGSGCSLPQTTNNGGTWNGSVNAPTTDGTNVIVAHDGNALSTLTFSGGAFGTVHDASSFTISIFGPVSLAGNLFFGGDATRDLYSYSTDFTTFTNVWTSSTALSDPLNASVVVGPSYAFGVPLGTNDGHFRAYNKSTGSATTGGFQYPTSGAKIGTVSAPALGADSLIYFTDSGNKELLALNTTPALPSTWSASFTGSTLQVIATTSPTNTVLDSVGTEPTFDSSGTLYFGTAAGKVYAIITDAAGPLSPSAGSTWPRVGYDNCNSSNTAFSCQ